MAPVLAPDGTLKLTRIGTFKRFQGHFTLEGGVYVSRNESLAVAHVSTNDRHHIFYQRRHYAGEQAKRLRCHWYARIDIPRDTMHRRIHEFVGDVPAPHPRSIRLALEKLAVMEQQGAIRRTDSFCKRLSVFIDLFSNTEPATAEALRRQLNIACEYC